MTTNDMTTLTADSYYGTYEPMEQDLRDLEQLRMETNTLQASLPTMPVGFRLMTLDEFRALTPGTKIFWLNARGNAHGAKVVNIYTSSLTYKTRVNRAVGSREWQTVSTFRAIVDGTMIRNERETGDGVKLPLIVRI